MFLKLDRLFARMRSTTRDESGATLVVVIALMAVGFIVSALIAAACLFAVQQTTSARANVQSFAAAEGGRDVVVAALSDTSELATPCTTPTYTGTDPQYTVTVFSTSDAAMPDDADGLSAACPTGDTNWVVLRSTSDVGGGSVTVDSVYQWVEYRQKLAGGGLGFMDKSYSVQGVTYSGDIIVRDGDFTCNTGSTIDGSVYVLDGNANVPFNWIDGLTDGGCDISGDLVVNRKDSADAARGNVTVNYGCFFIFFCGGRLTVGGQIKSSGNIQANGKLYAGTSSPAGDAPAPAPARIRDIQVAGTITTGANGRVETSNAGSIFAVGAISASTGPIVSHGSISSETSITAGGAISARVNVQSSGPISGGAAITATTGSIASDAGITGDGPRTAGATLSARNDLSGSGAKTGGIVIVGQNLTGGSVTASAGNLTVGGALTGSGARTATNGTIAVRGAVGTATTAVTGALTARTGIQIGGLLNTSANLSVSAGSLTAVGNITTTANSLCAISGDVRAGGVVVFPHRKPLIGSGIECRVAGRIQAFSGGSTTATSTLPAHSSSQPSLVFATIAEAVGGWTSPTATYYRKLPGNAQTNGAKNTVPTLPAAPTIVAPIDVPPTVFQMVNPATDTFVSIEELYLRTGWIDLGTYTNWTGYTKLPPLGVGQCTFGYVRGLLEASGDPVVIDATNCTSKLNLASWASVNLRRDAVILVKKVSVAFVPFTQTGATPDKPRQLFIVQVDNDVTERVGSSGGAEAPQPDCPAPTDPDWKISLTFAGWGPVSRWDDDVRVMLYSPCGIANGGGTLYNWEGHIYVANDTVVKDILAKVTCRRMTVENTLDLPCSVNDFGEWGGVHTEAASKLGERFRQSER